MPIEITTVYDKKRLIRFNDYVLASKVYLWVILGICSAIVVGGFIYMAILDRLSSSMYAAFAAIIVLDIFSVLCYVMLPRLMMGRNKNLNTVINYSFSDGRFVTEADSPHMHETATIEYSMIKKVRQKDKDLYLFVSSSQSCVVDVSGLDGEQYTQLKEMLARNIDPKKIKWQRTAK